jgi:autotransporter family porin
VSVDHVDFVVDGAVVGSSKSAPFGYTWNSASVADGTHSLAARATDEAGNVSSSASVSVVVSNAVPQPQPPVEPPVTHFSTAASGASGLPRSDSYCASHVTSSTWEPRPDNAAANNSMPADPSAIRWPTDSDTMYWSKWVALRSLVTGHFTGTTNQILQWGACKWGIDEDVLRAVAVQESHWHQDDLGDVCGPAGEASYGLMQVKNEYCDGSIAEGGYPQTVQSTALNVDYYGAKLRACYDNAFYDGGSWLYGGKSVTQIAAVNGWDYVLWGCVGYWYSGGWYDSGAKSYISSVQNIFANQTWKSF